MALLPGIENLDLSPLTGSVLVHYHSAAIAKGRILWSLTQEGYFEPARAVTHNDTLQCDLTTAGWAMGSLAVGALEIDSPALAV